VSTTASETRKTNLPTSADDVPLPALSAVRRAAARVLLTAGPPAVQQSIDIFCLPGPQQQTCRSGVQRPNVGTDGQTDGRTDARP